MARPTNASLRAQKVEEAENSIRDKVLELTQVLLDTAINASIKVTCPHCRRAHEVERIGDPKVAMSLLERVAGKVTEKQPETNTTLIEKLLVSLAGQVAAAPAMTAAQQAQAAIDQAKARAASVAALRAAR